jgi:hypothetical protein
MDFDPVSHLVTQLQSNLARSAPMESRKLFRQTRIFAVVVLAFSLLLPNRAWPIFADEGMWSFDNLPWKELKERFGFAPSREWLDLIRLSSVRFNDGRSGALVSPNGLTLTSYPVARSLLEKFSTAKKNYLNDGFYAKNLADEIRAPDFEASILVSIEDVTLRIQQSVQSTPNEKEALNARSAEIDLIEKESIDQTGLYSEVISLYQGNEYWLYRYQKYTDVRLVFAPEQQIASYGGDLDNFNYPRYSLNFSVFRVYENDKPLANKRYLRLNAKGATEDELVFTAGHPGKSDRRFTLTQLETIRDHLLPQTLEALNQGLKILRKYAAIGDEQARQAQELTRSLTTSIKALSGELYGLENKDLMLKKRREEEDFRVKVNGTPEWRKEFGGAWETIARAEQKQLKAIKQLRYRSLSRSFSELARSAQIIVRYTAEAEKPDAERLDGFHDAQLDSLKSELLAPVPIYSSMEEQLLAGSLEESLSILGQDDPFNKIILQGRTPTEAAQELISGTKLADPTYRKFLIEGGKAMVSASNDPLIVAARGIEPLLRRLRESNEEQIQNVITAAEEKIGRARFAVYGKSLYPEANFTLRLSYGVVKGYAMNGVLAPPNTTFFGLYDRAYGFHQRSPFAPPPRFRERQGKLDLATPLNFVVACDVIGGYFGSPVINRKAELVGLVFDGNLASLAGRFFYDDAANRAVAVHSAAIIETLRKIYDAAHLADELEGKIGRFAGMNSPAFPKAATSTKTFN